MFPKINLFLLLLAASGGFSTLASGQTALTNPAPAKIEVSIVVKGPDGAPFPGADVVLLKYGEGVQELKTDNTGRASVQITPSRQGAKVLGRMLVRAPGFGFNGGAIKAGENSVSLLKATQRQGRVVDATGAPLADIRVFVSGSRAQGSPDDFVYLGFDDMHTTLETRTDADGRFTFSDMPAGRFIQAGTYDPRYVSQSFELAEGNETTVKLLPGASLRGRVISEAGEGIAGVRVSARLAEPGRPGGSSAKTDAQGNYVLSGLPTGQFTVTANFEPKSPLVAAALQDVTATEGQEKELPPLKAVTGVLVTGVARDRVTGAALPRVGISLRGPQQPLRSVTASWDETDEQGRYEIRTLPGANHISVGSVPAGYLNNPQTQAHDMEVGPQGATVDFSFQLAPRLTGTIVDEKGKPLAATVKIGEEWNGVEVTSGPDGHFQTALLSLNAVPVTGGSQDGKMLKVLSPKKVSPPFDRPIQIVVRPVPARRLEGRTVTPAGEAIPNAVIRVQLDLDYGDGSGTSYDRQLQSDDVGKFHLDDLRPEVKVSLRGEKTGYSWIGGGEVTLQENTWRATDIVLEPLNRRLTGHVLAGDGRPAAGAKVSAFGQEAVAGADGAFEVSGLPARPVLVFATRGSQLAQATASDGPLELKLAPVTLQKTDPVLAAKMNDELILDAEAAKEPYYALEWLKNRRTTKKSDFEQKFELVTVQPGESRDDTLVQMVGQILDETKAGQLDPTTATVRLRRILGVLSRPERRFYALLDIVRRSPDPQLANEAWKEAKAVDAVLAGQVMYEDKQVWRNWGIWRFAVLSEQRDGAEADKRALDAAIAFVLKHYPEKPGPDDETWQETQGSYLCAAAQTVAEGSPALLRRLLDQIEPNSGYYVEALERAIPAVTKSQGYQAAKPLLDELEKMSTIQMKEAGGSYDRRPVYAFGKAVRRVIPLIGRQMPEEALALARRVKPDDTGAVGVLNQRAAALALIARWLPPAQAAPLWREIIPTVGAQQAARYALSAYEQDPVLGRELFEVARGLLPPSNDRFAYRPYRDAVTFAFYLAPAEPAQSRVLLENTWVEAASKKNSSGLFDVARAMARLDANRALEMAKAIPDDDGFLSLEARRKIAQWVEADETQRRDWPFDRWGASDTWTPGDEEW